MEAGLLSNQQVQYYVDSLHMTKTVQGATILHSPWQKMTRIGTLLVQSLLNSLRYSRMQLLQQRTNYMLN